MAGMMDLMTYRNRAGVTAQDEAAGMKAVDDWAAKQPGFQYRTYSRREDGTWVDLIFWRDAQAAAAGDEAWGATMLDSQAMRNMDAESWKRERLEVAGHLMGQPEPMPA